MPPPPTPPSSSDDDVLRMLGGGATAAPAAAPSPDDQVHAAIAQMAQAPHVTEDDLKAFYSQYKQSYASQKPIPESFWANKPVLRAAAMRAGAAGQLGPQFTPQPTQPTMTQAPEYGDDAWWNAALRTGLNPLNYGAPLEQGVIPPDWSRGIQTGTSALKGAAELAGLAAPKPLWPMTLAIGRAAGSIPQGIINQELGLQPWDPGQIYRDIYGEGVVGAEHGGGLSTLALLANAPGWLGQLGQVATKAGIPGLSGLAGLATKHPGIMQRFPQGLQNFLQLPQWLGGPGPPPPRPVPSQPGPFPGMGAQPMPIPPPMPGMGGPGAPSPSPAPTMPPIIQGQVVSPAGVPFEEGAFTEVPPTAPTQPGQIGAGQQPAGLLPRTTPTPFEATPTLQPGQQPQGLLPRGPIIMGPGRTVPGLGGPVGPFQAGPRGISTVQEGQFYEVPEPINPNAAPASTGSPAGRPPSAAVASPGGPVPTPGGGAVTPTTTSGPPRTGVHVPADPFATEAPTAAQQPPVTPAQAGVEVTPQTGAAATPQTAAAGAAYPFPEYTDEQIANFIRSQKIYPGAEGASPSQMANLVTRFRAEMGLQQLNPTLHQPILLENLPSSPATTPQGGPHPAVTPQGPSGPQIAPERLQQILEMGRKGVSEAGMKLTPREWQALQEMRRQQLLQTLPQELPASFQKLVRVP